MNSKGNTWKTLKTLESSSGQDTWMTPEQLSKATHEILNYLNNQHPNIRFTMETEKDQRIPILDTLVTRTPHGYYTSLYHKKTFTGIYLNWTSLTSRKYKISLIYCLCDRIWKICQREEDKLKEIDQLKLMLAKNEYPVEIINQEINKFIRNRKTTAETTTSNPNNNNNRNTSSKSLDNNTNENNNNIPTQEREEKQKKFIALPYPNSKADKFAKRLFLPN
jgi:hypothetical protein